MKKPKSAASLPRESEWVSRAKKGDKDAYRVLVEGYQDRLYGLVLSMVGNPQQAEDLTQEVLVKAYFALPNFKGGSAFYTWLFRIGSNHCLDYLRRRPKSEISLDAPLSDTDDAISGVHRLPAPAAENPDAAADMPSEPVELLGSLPEDQRLILTLRELENHSYDEIAAIMRCNINTVKSRLNRAREALKDAFARKFGNISSARDVQSEGETRL